MFNNSGKKIMAFSAIICWVGIIAFIILAISSFVDASHIFRDSEKSPYIIKGLIYLIGGPIASYVSGLLMHGFGELVDRFCRNNGTYSNDRVEKLNELRNQDLISEEEYNKAIAGIQKADDTDD